MRCTGSGSGDCCVAFEDGMCLATLDCIRTENNFVANEQNNYTCGKWCIVICLVLTATGSLFRLK